MLFDLKLIQKYDIPSPRYTSYPTANNFKELSLNQYQQQLAINNQNEISLYCHIPFCDTVCFYCGCNKIATKDKTQAERYLDYLFKEIDLQAKLLNPNHQVSQLHFGGGTPTFLTTEQLNALNNKLRSAFNFAQKGEFSIEIDPRDVDQLKIKTLANCGFNRISIGVQDFNLKVQKAVNRVQSFSETKAVIDYARNHGFESVSIDLIYGLPKQSKARFHTTLEKIISLKPERISLFNYAHLPQLFKPQRRINEQQLPSANEKLAILQFSIEYLLSHGYVYIGMDHFALPDDPLALAQKDDHLYRNFQGYSTHAQCDIIGLGLSSIGSIGACFSQNTKDLQQYFQLLDNNQIPVVKGLVINTDDKIRQAVIMDLICHFYLDFNKVEQQFNIVFKSYFEAELARLEQMQQDGLLTVTSSNIKVHERGRLLIRVICMVFDSYVQQSKSSFSKTI